jgi:hypothetical protein
VTLIANNYRSIRCLIGLTLIVFYLDSQAQKFIQAKVIDNKTSEPIAFASIRLFVNGKLLGGVVTNAEGDFKIPGQSQLTIDSLLVSCIGYANCTLKSNDILQVNYVIRLKESSIQLNEVEVKAKISARNIVKLAIENIPKNYPLRPFSYNAYYRDYQLEEKQYVNLNEAIVKVFDNGFGSSDFQDTKEKLCQYRENANFRRDPVAAVAYQSDKSKFIPGVQLYSFGGNELSILRIHDAIRNNNSYTYSYVNEFRKDFVSNHTFKLMGTVYLNNIAIYKLSFKSIYAVSGSSYLTKGEIYIEHGNFAIHKISYSAFERNSKRDKLLYDIELSYSRIDSLMYLNYLSCNNTFLVNISAAFMNSAYGKSDDNPVYKEVNQFRELFLVKLESFDGNHDEGPFILNNLPLKRNKIDSLQSASNYWMNTPLKK